MSANILMAAFLSRRHGVIISMDCMIVEALLLIGVWIIFVGYIPRVFGLGYDICCLFGIMP